MESQRISELIEITSARSPNRVGLAAAAAEGRSYTYSQINKIVDNAASHLVKRGFAKQEFILLMMESGPEWLISFLAIQKAGLVAIPVPPEIPPAFWDLIVQRTRVRAVIGSRRSLESVTSITPIRFCELEAETERADLSDRQSQPHDLAMVAFTSGSTQSPKAVALTQKNILADMGSIIEAYPATEEDCVLSVLPPTHLFELTVGQLVPMSLGVKIVYSDSLLPHRILKNLKEEGITHALAVPALLQMLFDEHLDELIDAEIVQDDRRHWTLEDFAIHTDNVSDEDQRHPAAKELREFIGESLRAIIIGGAAVDPIWVGLCHSVGIDLIAGYGLTEASPVVSLGNGTEIPRGSVGKPLPGIDVKIADNGELLLRGDNVTIGYWGDEEATSELLRDGWLHTGDHGHVDESGYLFVGGRLKDAMVTANGETVYPDEVEPYFTDEMFAEVSVVPLKGENNNDRPTLVVRPANPEYAEEDIQRIYKTLRAKAPARCKVDGLIITNQPLPRTALGKVKRRMLAEQIDQGAWVQ